MKYDHEIYAAIKGRPELHPQDLIGILLYMGGVKGVLSEADQDRFPNHAELSFGLQSLVDAGKIAEVSPHKYYDADGSSCLRTFSGVLPNEYAKAYAAYFQRIRQAGAWKLDLVEWPGPDRARWSIDQDSVLPSPDGQFACVLYSCAEVKLGWTVGLLALLKGPPERPRVMLRPCNFTCSVGRNRVQWLDGGRYCVVVPFLFNQAANNVELLALTFLDVVNETFAHYEMSDILYSVGQEIFEEQGRWIIRPDVARFKISYGEHPTERKLEPAELAWRPWQELRGTSPAPSFESLESLRVRGLINFAETPYGPVVQWLEKPKKPRWWQFCK